MTETSDAELTRHVTDAEIRAVVDHYDDPEHPDAMDLPGARERLAELQRALESRWDDYLTAIREGDLQVVRDLGRVVVLQDPSRREWDRLLDSIDCFDQVDRTILRVTHHQAASRLLERSVEGVDPVVARKPAEGDAGQRLAEAVVDGLLRRGLQAGEAWAYYGVELRGHSSREWAERCGREDHVAVADAVETAGDRLGR